MKANQTMLITALAVGSLLVCSPALRAGVTNTPPSTPPAGAPPAGQPPRGGFDRLAEQLNLTADQKPKVQSIMQAQMDKILALRQDTSLTVEDRRAKAKAIHENTAAQMKAVLTADQFQKWQDMQSKMRNRRNGTPPAGTPPPTTVPQQ
jgi:Spy/CpxP family protein refolding chaperone